MSSAKLRDVADLIRGWIKDGAPQTMVVVVARRGVIVMHEAFGQLTPDPTGPKTPCDAIFELASITKVLTATSLMTLVEDGRVGLNRPVSMYIPEFRGPNKDAVLVRHLLTHTSGLKPQTVEDYAEGPGAEVIIPPTPATVHPLCHEYLYQRYGAPTSTAPDEEMCYANINLELAADIVRRVSGRSLDRFAEERIFGPLGMKDTHYCRVDVPLPRRVIEKPFAGDHPRWWRDGMMTETERFCMGSNFAWSTALDLAIFCQTFLNGGAYGDARILSPLSVRAMTRNQTAGIPAEFFGQKFPESCWGLGWGVSGNKPGWNGALPADETFGHVGSGGVECWADPIHEVVMADLSSTVQVGYTTPDWAKTWRNDLLTDAVLATITDL